MKIVVTGSTGRVGANLVKRLGDSGHDVTACLLPNDKHESKLDGMKLRKAYFDILDGAGMMKVIEGSDIVIHLAAVHEGSSWMIPVHNFFDINVKGMFNVLEGIRYSEKTSQLICLSSAAVYDVFTCPRSPIDENLERKPITVYGLTKILVEEQVRQYELQYGIPSTILRPNYIMSGPDMLDAFNYTVVLDVLEKYAENSNAQFHYSTDPRAWANAKKHDKMGTDALCIPRSPEGEAWQWHMVDVRDVVNVVEECLENENAFGKTFNIAGADVCDWSKLVPYIGEKTGRKIVEIEIPNVWQYSFDQSALKNDLGFSSNFDHFQMIDAALAMSNNEDVGIIKGDAFTY